MRIPNCRLASFDAFHSIEALENRTLFAVGTLVGTARNLNSTIGTDCADPVRNVAYFVDQGNEKIVEVPQK